MGKSSSSKKSSPSKTDASPVAPPPATAADPAVEEKESHPANLSVIAHPLAGKKLAKKVLKTVKKAAKSKHVKRGVKEVVKALRKGEKGMVVLAGDISPIDVITHLPVLCEENSVPYCYVPSKSELGQAGCTKRPTSVILVPLAKKTGADYEESFDACCEEIQGLPILPSAVVQ